MPLRFRYCAFLVTLSIILPWPCLAEEPLAEGVVVPVAATVNITATSPPGISWSQDFQKEGSHFLRLHFSGFENANADVEYTVVLRDRNWKVLRAYAASDISSHNQFWSPLTFGDYVRVEVMSERPPLGLKFKIDKMAYSQRGFAKYSYVHNPPELEPILAYQSIPDIYGPSHAVAKLVFSTNGQSNSCTGFLISDEILITNQHCIDREESCRGNATAIFGFERTPNGLQQGEQFECLALVFSDKDFDFSLLRLTGTPGVKYGHLELTRRPPILLEQTYLIQHPGGEPKQIARKECFLSTLNAEATLPNTDLGHMCDTINGASGSPLLGRDYKVIGLHHFGFDLFGRWQHENRAVQIGKIMDRAGL